MTTWNSRSSGPAPDPPGEHGAFLERATGRIWFVSDSAETEETPPDDLDDEARYAEVPHKNDLGLGGELAERFAGGQSGTLGEAVEDALRDWAEAEEITLEG